MERKIQCFGVRNYEIPYFKQLAKKHNYELELVPELISNDNRSIAYGNEAIMVRANCNLNKESLQDLKDKGLKIILTRTVGYAHINPNDCKELGIAYAYVPAYSPNAVAELAVSLALMLNRSCHCMVNKVNHLDCKVYDNYFCKEIRNQTIGILGCGRIGMTAAKLFHGLGAKVIGYDVFKKESTDFIQMVELEDLLKQADIISIHMPYIKGKNDNYVNKELISKMKNDVIIINTSRGEVVNEKDIIQAIKDNQIRSYGCDVITHEKQLFGKVLDKPTDDIHQQLISLFPRVIMTPHVGSATDQALIGMIETSLQNCDEYLKTGIPSNSLIK